jgi:hypothetical protein
MRHAAITCVAGVTLILAVTATAQPIPPERKADWECEKKIIAKLGTAANERLIDQSRQHDKGQFTACISDQMGGGRRLVLAMCDYAPTGDPVGEFRIMDSSIASNICGRGMQGQ